jgi:hypothetical protein
MSKGCFVLVSDRVIEGRGFDKLSPNGEVGAM